MTSADQIVRWYYTRRNNRGADINMAHEIRDAYNGTIALPLPELNRNERAAVANLVKQGINQAATRAGSTIPTLLCLPAKETKGARDLAGLQRKGLMCWWEENEFKSMQYRRLRHLIGYASAPVMLRFNTKRGIPVWQTMDPLAVYPSPAADLDDVEPANIIHAFTRPFSYIQANPVYGELVVGLEGADKARPDDLFMMLEYADADEQVLIVLGKSQDPTATQYWTTSQWQSEYQGAKYRELLRVPNPIGVCPAVVPGRITLDKPQGMFDGMLPLFIKRARLAALEEIAIEKGVFENEWFVADTDQGDIVVEADGRMGVVGHVVGGRMEWHTPNVSQAVNIALDRYERQERVEGSIPAEFGGESASNVRTDRRGNTILSVAQDPGMIETHEIMARSYRCELERAVALAKAHAPNRSVFGVDGYGPNGVDKDAADKVFPYARTKIQVRWSMPGSDINQLTVAGGQRVQMGTLSKRGFMEIDPLVDDVEAEHDRITAELFETLLPTSIQTDLQAGLLTGLDLARMMELVVTNKLEPWEAYNRVHADAQQRQAQQQQAQQAQPGTPDAMPGVTQPGEAGPPAQPAGLGGLSALMSQLRGPMRATPAEQGAAA